MGDFNHGNIKWDTLQSTGVEDSMFLCLVQDNFLTQHVLEPTRAARVLDIVLSSQKEFVDNVRVPEELQDYFSEMQPVFKNASVTRDDIGPFMRQYAEEHDILSKPRVMLVGSFRGVKILLATPLL